jgi:hypothetical protein
MRNLPSLAFACALLISGTSVQAAETFTILQDKPELTDIAMGEDGPSHGDILAFEASFTGEDGAKGTMSGFITTVDIPSGADEVFFDRIANIVLDFGGIDTLVVGGKSVYPAEKGEINVDAPQVRAVTGGTGRFIGASGQITTTRRDAGHYEHKIELVD